MSAEIGHERPCKISTRSSRGRRDRLTPGRSEGDEDAPEDVCGHVCASTSAPSNATAPPAFLKPSDVFTHKLTITMDDDRYRFFRYTAQAVGGVSISERLRAMVTLLIEDEQLQRRVLAIARP